MLGCSFHLRRVSCVKSVDLTRLGLAVPIVDEIAGAALDLWARERGAQTAVTDEQGQYRFISLAPGPYSAPRSRASRNPSRLFCQSRHRSAVPDRGPPGPRVRQADLAGDADLADHRRLSRRHLAHSIRHHADATGGGVPIGPRDESDADGDLAHQQLAMARGPAVLAAAERHRTEGRITVFAQPRDGSLRMPAQNYVDLRFEKGFGLGAERRLTLMADVLNIGNIDTLCQGGCVRGAARAGRRTVMPLTADTPLMLPIVSQAGATCTRFGRMPAAIVDDEIPVNLQRRPIAGRQRERVLTGAWNRQVAEPSHTEGGRRRSVPISSDAGRRDVGGDDLSSARRVPLVAREVFGGEPARGVQGGPQARRGSRKDQESDQPRKNAGPGSGDAQELDRRTSHRASPSRCDRQA